MKKWLTFIFLVIAAAGTFIPCCQIDDCCADQLTSPTADHQDHKEEGTCSPFVACATCPGFVQLTKRLQLVPPIAEKQAYGERIIAFAFSTYSASYWQPPKTL